MWWWGKRGLDQMGGLKWVAVLCTMALTACSTNGEMYKEGDPVNGQFSVWRTIALPFAVVGVVAGAAVGGAAAGAAAVPQPAPTYTYYPASSRSGVWINTPSGLTYCSRSGNFV